jgi:hypothetical protein
MTTISQTIPSLGSPPLTSDPTNFDTRADTLYGTSLPAVITAVNTWAGQANTVAGEVNADKLAAAASAVASAASAVTSGDFAGDAETAATQAATAANFQGEWAGLVGDLDLPASVRHNNVIWLLLTYLPDVTASEPGVTADWAAYKQVAVTNRTSNTILTANDFGAFIRYTSGTFTQTFTAVATLSVGWFVWLKNAGTGDITLDPNASELIDGLASFVMYPNELRLVMVNAAGTGFDSFVYNGFEKVFTTSGTFTKPPGYKAFDGLAWSAGASGARGNPAQGGHGGGCFPFSIPVASFGATETITIAAGGAARTTDGVPNAGGNTTIGSLLTVVGAKQNLGGAISANGVVAITSVNSGNNAVGFEGASQSSTGSASSVYGGACSESDGGSASGSSIYGGAAGGSHDGTLRAAGTSLYGGNGGAAGDSTNGTAGAQPAGGGGATRTGTNSGAGGDGQVTIRGVV